MYIEVHDRLGNPVRVPATRLVVFDDFGNPVSLAVELGPRHIRTSHVGEESFRGHLEELGLASALIVTRYDVEQLRGERPVGERLRKIRPGE